MIRALEHLDPQWSRSEAKAAEAAVAGRGELGLLNDVPIAVKSHLEIEGTPETMPFCDGIASSNDLTAERLRGAGPS